ncbi:MAG: hypothetical protein KKB66_01790 [Alphaproteobacteria bacterium]|nr:hypothetical protein [Alphaproteobacteria bacterium]MBU0801992.1 hypothetical protein [Alphaproteobacteria bacterium]MBU0872401.1 hypothetical protein [Alphaproteobacteria bacterium]MBU1399491.1 hypothetical protein [Alphaproteobacteria bacterium]MBU1589877.1 hypothetical protein [Alphaproteobacteria bacterium]
MKKKLHFGKCSVCGVPSRLTLEHVPPEAAFNSSSIRHADLRHYFDSGIEGELLHPDAMRHGTSRKGAGGYTLCQVCNNSTGAWYARHYVVWTYQAMTFYMAGGSQLALPFRILPGAVAKQLVCMFASACGPGMFDANPSLRKYVLDREAIGIDPNIRIFCFMISPKSSRTRQAGITGLMNMGRGPRSHVFAEISFPPFGYLMTFNSEPPEKGLTDITFFTHEHWRHYREIHLPLPLREVHTYFPGDYRTGDEWRITLEKTRGKSRRSEPD